MAVDFQQRLEDFQERLADDRKVCTRSGQLATQATRKPAGGPPRGRMEDELNRTDSMEMTWMNLDNKTRT